MKALVAKFYSEALGTLLFLKHVETVEFYLWRAGANAPERTFCVSLAASASLRAERALLASLPPLDR
jgi:hypothetical protein